MSAPLSRARLAAVLLTAAVVAACAAPQPRSGPEPAALDTPPALGPIRPYQMPAVSEFRLENGLRVVVVEQRSMPLVTMRVIVEAGANDEPEERAGLAVLTGTLLQDGTAALSGNELAERLEQLGAQLQTGASLSLAFANLTAVPSVFREAARLVASTLIEPAFREEDFARARTQAIAAYRQNMATVEGLAGAAFSRAVFEPEAPYGRPIAGTARTLEGLRREHVVSWHHEMYAPRRATLLLVGDLSPAEAREVAQDAFGHWRAQGSNPSPVVSRPRPVSATRVILIDRPGSVQSAIRIGQASIGMEDPDYLRMLALSQVLGGAFNARINQNLRERHGWTYGAFSNFNPMRGAGTFMITSSVRTTATDSALVESVREYRELAGEAVPQEELTGALNNIVGSFPTSVLTVQGLAQRMQTLILYGLPLDYYADYRERVAALTAGELLAASERLLLPEALTIVVAGDLATIEEPIRALGLGAVEVWDAEGARVR